MYPTALPVLTTWLVGHFAVVTSFCSNPGQAPTVTIPETAGTERGYLFRLQASRANVTFTSFAEQQTNRSFNQYFKLKYEVGYYQLVLTKVIGMDQERTVPRTADGNVKVKVIFTCKDLEGSRGTYTIPNNLIVKAVDNHPLEVRSDFKFNIREDLQPGQPFANVLSGIRDGDYPDLTAITSFSLVKDPSNKADGFGVFQLDPNGDISVADGASLDYDSGNKSYTLKLKATNNVNQTGYGRAAVNLLNINDNPPEFIFNGCTKMCTVMHYEVTADKRDQNIVIKARDLDNDRITFSMVTGSPSTFRDFVVIDNQTAKVSLKKMPDDPNLGLILLVVRATSHSTLPPSKNADYRLFEDEAVVLVWPLNFVAELVSDGSRYFPDWLLLLASALTMVQKVVV